MDKKYRDEDRAKKEQQQEHFRSYDGQGNKINQGKSYKEYLKAAGLKLTWNNWGGSGVRKIASIPSKRSTGEVPSSKPDTPQT